MDISVAFVKICLHEVQMTANLFHRQSPFSRPKPNTAKFIYTICRYSFGNRSCLLAEVSAFISAPCEGQKGLTEYPTTLLTVGEIQCCLAACLCNSYKWKRQAFGFQDINLCVVLQIASRNDAACLKGDVEYIVRGGTLQNRWLTRYATSQKSAVLSPDKVFEFFQFT